MTERTTVLVPKYRFEVAAILIHWVIIPIICVVFGIAEIVVLVIVTEYPIEWFNVLVSCSVHIVGGLAMLSKINKQHAPTGRLIYVPVLVVLVGVWSVIRFMNATNARIDEHSMLFNMIKAEIISARAICLNMCLAVLCCRERYYV